MRAAKAPQDSTLREIYTSLPTRPDYTQENSPYEDQYIVYAQWDPSTVTQRHGYRFVQLSEDIMNFHPQSAEATIAFPWRRAQAETRLGQSVIGSLMRDTGIFTESTRSTHGGKEITNYHIAYPTTENFVTAINPALQERDSNVRFFAFPGAKFPAQLLTEGAAANPMRIPIGTEAHQNEHDLLTHALGWIILAEKPLAEKYLFPIRSLAQATISASESGVQKAYPDFGEIVEGNINSVWIGQPYKRKVNFQNLAKYAQVSPATIIEDIHAHLYPGKTPEEAYLM